MMKELKINEVVLARFKERQVELNPDGSPKSIKYVTIEGVHELEVLDYKRDDDGKLYYKVFDPNLNITSWFEEWEIGVILYLKQAV